jgi:ribose 5-phosphate isomerase A
MTENENAILDTKFESLEDDELEKKIKLIPGVIESGLFFGYNVEIMRV